MKLLSFCINYDKIHASYIGDPEHRNKLLIIQVTRLSQVFNSQRQGNRNKVALNNTSNFHLEEASEIHGQCSSAIGTALEQN